jgi:hypothetical protein
MTRLVFALFTIVGASATLGAFIHGTNAMPSLWLLGLSFAMLYATKGVTK